MREGWKMQPWEEVLEIRSGRNQKEVLDANGRYPIMGSAGSIMGYANDYLCEEGTTIIGRKGTIDNPMYIETKFWNVDTAFGLVAGKSLNRRFLFYFCKGYNFKSLNKGTTLPSLVKKDLVKIKIPIPPLTEQKQIVALLDKAFAAIDQAKANIAKNIENAKELFQSKLNEIFSHPSTGSGQDGDGWEEKSLGEVCENLDSRRVPITKNKREAGSIPYYGASGIVDYVADYLFDEDLLLVSEDGANLLARTYPIAFSISGKTWVNNHAHVLRFENMTNQLFIEYYLNSIKLDDYISGMAQPKLNQKKLNSIQVPFPSARQQEEIVNTLNNLSEFKTKLLKGYEQKMGELEDLKKSILQKAFAGELIKEETESILQMAAEPGATYQRKVNSQAKQFGRVEKSTLGGHIINIHFSEGFGRTHLMKLLHLTEYNCKLNFGTEYYQYAAGPYSHELISDIESSLKRYRFFKIHQSYTGKQKVTYTPLAAASQIEGLFQEHFEQEAERINSFLAKFKGKTWSECEVISTLYAVWNNRICLNKPISIDLLKQDFLNWDDQKAKYADDLDAALLWMNENNVVPEGWGRVIEAKN